MPLTPQQQAAVECRGTSVVLSSGAGCGKTHVLTARYLSHLRLDGAAVGQVVAITFTERAARQMRERVRSALRAERDAPGADAALWAGHLRDLDSAPVCTIHAFCGNLLRQHAVAAGLDPRFEILEDVLADNLRSEALLARLHALLVDAGPLGDDLRELVLLHGWAAVLAAVGHLAGQYDAAAWQAWCARSADDIAADWAGPARAALLPAWAGHVAAAGPKVAWCLDLLRAIPCSGPVMKANVARLLAETPTLASAADLGAAVESLRKAATVMPEKAKAWPDEDAYRSVQKALEGYREELPERFALFADHPEGLADAATVGQRFLRVAAAAAEAYRERKRRAGAVDFQDLLVLARDLLRDRAEVREALARRYPFVLIDELQDTDPVQMELVRLLCGEGLAHGKLFTVGDHKQSIYRFRGAEVGLFQGLRREVAAAGRLGLTVNFRSQPQVLHFVNALFRTRLEDYEPLAASHAQANPAGCVEFLWSLRPTAGGEAAPRESAAEGRAREADAVARRIAGMVAGEERLVRDEEGGLRPVRPGDVVLLFRSMSHVAIYEAALRRYGLDYYLVGGRAFYAQQEVYDLLNLLRALENPSDAVALVGALRSPFAGLSDESLYHLARHPDGPWAGLHDEATRGRLPAEQCALAAAASTAFARWRAIKDRVSIARLLGEVFADSAYDAATQFEFLGDRKLANLWKLQDLARTFDRSGLFGLAEFVARLGELVRTQPREEQAATQPENADVVRLMSVHQSKGLEFPVVFVPDLAAAAGSPHLPAAHWDARLGCVVRPPSEEPPPFTDFGWRLWRAHEALAEWHEDLRTLYVACTRAEDYLVLSAALPERPPNAWTLLLAERFDLRTGACRDPDLPAEARPLVRVTPDHGPPARGGRVVLRPAVPIAAEEPIRRAEPAAVPWPAVVPLAALARGEGLLAAQWDAEDESDRSEWAGPRADAGPAGRLLWGVLRRWDFRDADGWQHLLADAAADAAPGPGQAEALAADLAPLLSRFAGSETRARLAAAAELRREVAFLLPWPAGDTGGPALSGVLDFLWRDGDGWHLLAIEPGPTVHPAAAPGKDRWWGRRDEVQALAWAARSLLGSPPATATLVPLAGGSAVRLRSVDESAALTALTEALRRWT